MPTALANSHILYSEVGIGGTPAVATLEQKEKLERRTALCVELSQLEQMLVRCEYRELKATEKESTDREQRLQTPVDRLAAQSTLTPSKPSVAASESAQPTQRAATASKASTESCVPGTVLASVDAEVKGIAAGKKGKRVKGISLEEFERLSAVPSAAKANLAVATPSTAGTAGNPWKQSKAAVSSPPAAEDTPSISSITPSGRTVLSPQPAVPVAAQLNAVVRPPVSPYVTPVKAPINAIRETAKESPQTDVQARGRSLFDFMPAAVKGTPVPAPPAPTAKPGWTTPTAVHTPTTPAKLSGSKPSTTFSDIQRAEEEARRASNMEQLRGNTNPWYVERRPRAESIGEVARQQLREKEEAEEVRLALLAVQAAQAKAKAEQEAKNKAMKKKSGGASKEGKEGKEGKEKGKGKDGKGGVHSKSLGKSQAKAPPKTVSAAQVNKGET
jgi:hypothetical protein